MRQARFTAFARKEFLAEISYYEALRAGLGARFRTEVEAVAERAAAFPKSGAPSVAGARKRLLSHFPFSVVYTEMDYGVLIHAIAHNRRFPEYWVGRLADEG